MAVPKPLTLRLLGRPYCHLCAEMLQVLAPFRARKQVQVEWVDVDSDPVLAEQYDELIPVLLLGEREIAHHVLREAQIAALLET